MADGGPPASQPLPVAPQVQHVVPPAQLVVSPAQPDPLPQLNWSHFKPDEDAEAHLLRTNDWMDTHAFQEGVESKGFA